MPRYSAHYPPDELICPRCQRPASTGRRCLHDDAYYVTRAAFDDAGRDGYLGELIGGRYAIVERIGVGGMGSVYRGLDEAEGVEIAVKFLRNEYIDHPTLRERFIREAEAGVSLQSPHIVPILDFGIDNRRTLFIVMELVDGWTLRDEINRNGPFSVADAVELGKQVLAGLVAAHDVEVIHRDLKHDNLMISGPREGFLARILDFGVVKITAADALETGIVTQSGVLVGSPSYMSPEQMRGLDVGPPADLYSVGVVLYEAMTARRLFKVNDYDSLLRAGARRDAPPLKWTARGEPVPTVFNRLLQRTLRHDPSARFADARTMLLALEQMHLEDDSSLGLLADAPGHGIGALDGNAITVEVPDVLVYGGPGRDPRVTASGAGGRSDDPRATPRSGDLPLPVSWSDASVMPAIPSLPDSIGTADANRAVGAPSPQPSAIEADEFPLGEPSLRYEMSWIDPEPGATQTSSDANDPWTTPSDDIPARPGETFGSIHGGESEPPCIGPLAPPPPPSLVWWRPASVFAASLAIGFSVARLLL